MTQRLLGSRPARRLSLAAVWLVLLIVFGAMFLPGTKPSAASTQAVEHVDVAKLVPHYHGQLITWAEVGKLKAQGKAAIVWFYSDNSGNYAYVFDSEAEVHVWQCHTPGFNAKPGQCTNTTNRAS